jgi:ketosteroid isomerase-like protein
VELTEGLLENLLAALPIGDIGSGWETRAERMREISAPDLETAMIAEEGGLHAEFHGVDGYREAWTDWLEPFDSYRVELEEVRETADGLIVLTRQWVTPKGTDSSIAGEAAGVLRFADGRLQRIEFHLDRDAACRAAGLDPQSIQE